MRGPRNGNNCRENGYQLQIKDTSTNLCQKKKKKLGWANQKETHHSSIAFRYVSQISVSSNCYLSIDVFHLLVSLPFCLDWSLASFLQLTLSFHTGLKFKGFFFISWREMILTVLVKSQSFLSLPNSFTIHPAIKLANQWNVHVVDVVIYNVCGVRRNQTVLSNSV